HEESGVPLGSIIPWARNSQDCRASIIASAAHHRIGPANLTSVPVQRPKESEGAVVSLNFKSDRRAHDEAARGKRSRRDRPRTEAGPTESNCSGDTKAPLIRASAVLSNVPCHVECSSPGSREGAIQDVGDIRYLDGGDVSLVAVTTGAADVMRPAESAVAPVEGVVADSACESNDLSGNRAGSQGHNAACQGAS